MKVVYKLLSFVLLFACPITAGATHIDAYEKTVNQITFSIDARIELYNIVAIQAGHHQMTLSNIPYKKECLDYFSKHKNLEAPKLLIETWKNGWGVDDPIFFMLHLDNDFNLSEDINDGIVKRGGGIEYLTKLAKAFKEFAQKSDFATFFNEQQKDFYNQVLLNAAYNFKDFKGVEHMERYYGVPCDSYHLILNINGGYGNFGTAIPSENGTDLYAVVETNTHSGDIPTYHPTILLVDLIIHEFSHGFINPVIDSYYELISKSEHLYKPISESMRNQGYWSWSSCATEHIVFATVTRIAELYYGKQFSDNTLYKLTIARRLIYVDAIIEKLKVYENNRDTYPTFKDFAPELVKVFGQISEDYITEKQQKVEDIRDTHIENILKPYQYAKDSTTYFIVGTHENDKEQEKQMHAFVFRFRDMISKHINIITDDEAMEKDISNSDIVVFGTPKGNSFLEKHIDKIPVKMTADYILTNKIVKGNKLQLVTSWTNPFNTKKLMTIYTAQKTSDIINFNASRVRNIYHYWIAKDLLTLEKGNYERFSGVWMPKAY